MNLADPVMHDIEKVLNSYSYTQISNTEQKVSLDSWRQCGSGSSLRWIKLTHVYVTFKSYKVSLSNYKQQLFFSLFSCSRPHSWLAREEIANVVMNIIIVIGLQQY